MRLSYLMPSDLSCLNKPEFLALRYDINSQEELDSVVVVEPNQATNEPNDTTNPVGRNDDGIEIVEDKAAGRRGKASTRSNK